jgi:hypothetical protein
VISIGDNTPVLVETSGISPHVVTSELACNLCTKAKATAHQRVRVQRSTVPISDAQERRHGAKHAKVDCFHPRRCECMHVISPSSSSPCSSCSWRRRARRSARVRSMSSSVASTSREYFTVMRSIVPGESVLLSAAKTDSHTVPCKMCGTLVQRDVFPQLSAAATRNMQNVQAIAV